MIGGVVLAAGAGRRFGGLKLAAELGGRPLLDRAVDAMLAASAIERVVVVLGADAEAIEAAASLDRVEIVRCEGWREGISASLRAGIDALAEADAVVVALGDQPFVTVEAIEAIAALAGGREPAARATYDGRPGHPVLIKRDLYEQVRSLTGDTGARDLLAAAGARELECGRLARPDDVDTTADLTAARAAIEARGATGGGRGPREALG